ncbi:uncharacterized protein LOC127496289 isoform X1 [Ctenopharyngodon idella]|uniref:uncharacterized protein LOC127496289 isoform X1 n=1 Tax=Ctenopharyngodon idella TaxID=7959 RepID=UPI00222E16A8|nr:uncharacterized protein LOC127496289 isoform X1 [Ctenopharyngodon idella]
MPKSIRGLQDSCLVIPCSFSYSSYPPKNPRRVVWYQWVSKGYPLVYDPWYPNEVIDKFRWKTDLYGNPSNWDCSLLITNLEQSHHGEKLYAWIDPENVGWRTYAFYDVTSTIHVDNHPELPDINIYGGDKIGDTITVACSTLHSCPYSKPNIILNGIEGCDKINSKHIKDSLWKITRTCTSVVKAERLTIMCSVTHHGGITVTATKVKSAHCVHQKITIEPELTDFKEGVAKNFVCSVYHSCQKETPTITWNYKNMQVLTGSKTLSGLGRITYSSITFLGSKQDHGKKLICTAKFSGGKTETSVVLQVQRVMKYDVLGLEVRMPKDIHGLQGSCLVIPCSFSYTSNPPKAPRRVVWYQWVSKGYHLVYDPSHASDVIEKFRGKTDLYGNSAGECSLLIKNLEQSHHGEKLYTRIDPENVGWGTYTFDDVTSTIHVNASSQPPSINIYGGERMGDTITIVCSAVHSCPYSKPNIILKGIEGTDKIDNEQNNDGLWKIILTRTGVIKAESSTIECSVTHHGGITVTATKVKSAHCVHQKIMIEPELTDFKEGVAKNFVCSVYHSCQKETPNITWNYENMQVSKGRKTLSGLDQVTYSSITFLGSKQDHGKKLICTAKFSGGNTETSVFLHVQRVMKYDVLGLEVRMPKDIHGLQGSCLVIPCSFSYTSNPPKAPRRVVWYQWVSKGYPLVYDPSHASDVIEKFRGKTDLYGNSAGECSLLIKNLEQSHHGEKLYTRIDPENVGWGTYTFDDVTSTIHVNASSQQPSINIYGGERMGDTITIVCSAVHSCPYSKPSIILKGIEGTDKIDNEQNNDGLWKIILTRTGVIKAESSTIECSVTHHGGITVTATKVKSAHCVHQKITIEPELADVTEGVAKNFTCSVYHSCQKETPTITWNYENMQVLTGRITLSGLDQVTYSNITFLGSKDDHGKKLICTAKFSGQNTETYVVLYVKEYQKPVDPIQNETYFQYEADVIPKITALTRSCVVIPCSFKMEEENTRLRVLWVTKKGGYMFHTDSHDVLDNFRGRTKLLGNPDEQNCTVEMDNVQTHDNGPFCFKAEKENEKYSFNNSCVFIIMRASPDKPVMSSLPEDIEPGTRVTVKCSVNHTCSSHPPKITWSVPTARETISHNHMGGGIWETVSAVTFIPTGYEEKDEIVCSANFWGGKTQNNTAFLSVKRVQEIKLETFGLYAIAPSLVFILICVLAGVCIYKRRHRQPCQDMQGLQTQSEHRRSLWNRFSSHFNMPDGRAAWTNRGDRSDIRNIENAPARPLKPEQRRSIWTRFSRHQSPRNNANLRVEYKTNNTCTVSGNKPFSKPRMPSPKSEPKSYPDYDAEYTNMDELNMYGNI